MISNGVVHMYLRILRRDLLRQKVMNLVLLLFILLSSMFISSSVSNILSVTGAIDGYFQKAGVPDLLIGAVEKEDAPSLDELLSKTDGIHNFRTQPIFYATKDNLLLHGNPLSEMNGTGSIYGFENVPITLFDEQNQPIRQVEPGTMWMAAGVPEELGLHMGDVLELRYGNIRRSFTLAGVFKDATSSGSMMISREDLNYFQDAPDDCHILWGALGYVTTDDPASVRATVLKNDNINGAATPEELESNFIMDMIIAGILLVVSVVLILVAFVMLRFTITFSLSEEFRQIGVMKAIGIPHRKIRGLYMTKYAFLSLIGGIAGFFVSIPFGNLLLDSVSKTMVMETDGGFVSNMVCSLAVALITILFCFGCTRKVKKISPMDAIRSGSAGERFRKKGYLRLGKTPGRPSLFLAINDVISNPRRFGFVIVTFALCLSLVLILVTSVNTLKSKKLIPAFGLVSSDLYMIRDTQQLMTFFAPNGRQMAEASLAQMEQDLSKGGIPGDCSLEAMMTLTAIHNNNELKTIVFQGIGTKASDYNYYQGSAPKNAGEIAITSITADRLGVTVGDSITFHLPEGDLVCKITGLYQSMMNMGEGIRLHEDLDISFAHLTGLMSYQINFHDDPSDEVISDRISQVEALLHTKDTFTGAEYVEEMAGVANTLDAVRQLVLLVVLIIIALITVLMEHSFLTQERSQIALLKAVGIPTGSLLLWHSLRFALVSALASILSLATLVPLTKLLISPIFSMMGANFGIEFDIPVLEVYLIYPAIVFAITMISALLTALRIRGIQARECAGVD